MSYAHTRGFTLFELAIVLVIIGLLVGGVLLGNDLIKAAQLRNVVKEAEELRTAINTFKAKYHKWPGDTDEASQYWGAQTIDGNNDGVLSVLAADNNYNMGDGDDGPEYLRVWQQLGLAELISGNYTGLPAAGTPYVPGINMPPTRFDHTGGYVVWDNRGLQGSNVYIPNLVEWRSKMALVLAGQWAPGDSDWPFYVGLLMPADAYAIDAKSDDGIAYSGSTLGLTGNPSSAMILYGDDTCSSPVLGPSPQDYSLTQTAPACIMIFNITTY
jgi:prepilin-type N-terminal cleavage/methylation domain-containing protein